MTFRRALAKAIKRDVLFMHVDCGAFTPYRWNPKNLQVEYWGTEGWTVLTAPPCETDDWIVTDRLRPDHEEIVYKD